MRYLGDQAESISVRDGESRRLLRSIEAWRKPVRQVPDLVFGLDLGTPEVPDPVRELAESWRILAFNLRPWPAAEEAGLHDELARALGQVARAERVALVAFPMQAGEKMDQRASRECLARVEADVPKLVLDWTSNWRELFGTIFASEAVLSMRLHACMLSYRLGTPAVGIHYDPKVSSLFEALGVPERSLPVETGSDEFSRSLRAVLADGGRVESKVNRRVRTLEGRAVEELHRLGSALAAAPPASRPRRYGELWSAALA